MELRPYLWMNSKNIEPLCGVNVLWCNYLCLIGTLSTHKGLIHTVENVGSGIGHDPATEVTQLKLNQLPFFPVIEFLMYKHCCTCKDKNYCHSTRLKHYKRKKM